VIESRTSATSRSRTGSARKVSAPLAGTLALLAALVTLVAAPAQAGPTLNGFDLGDASVPLRYVDRGGPPRDGIPSIDNPKFVSADAATKWLDAGDRVLGLALDDGAPRAYPIRILNWHEIVNDEIAGEAFVISWCPLCGSAVAFRAEVEGVDEPLEFGVSGLLYNSDVLLYDRQTESLWSQLKFEAISGPLKGTKLEPVPMDVTTFEDWRDRHPVSAVLSPRTGYDRPYDRDPYEGYDRQRRVMFPLEHQDNRLHPKAEVLGVTLDGAVRAYPFSELEKIDGSITDTIGGRKVQVHFDREHERAWITDAGGERLPGVISFWFAWHAFNPDTEVWAAQ